jgi:hypothetical protein
MAEVLGTWAGLDRRVGAVRRWLLNKPELEPEALAQVRARLERVLEELVDDGHVWLERPRVVEDLHAFAGGDRPAGGVALGQLPLSTRMSARCLAQVSSSSSRLFNISPPAAGGRRAEEAHDGLRLSGGSGIEAAGGSKLIGRTGRRGSSSGIGWW